MNRNLSNEERVLIKRIVSRHKQGKIGSQFHLTPVPDGDDKKGKLMLADYSRNFRSSDFTGYQGTIDSLVANGFLQRVKEDLYYLPQAAFDAFDGTPRIQYTDTQSSVAKLVPGTINEFNLVNLLKKYWSIDELKSLCIGFVEPENLPHSTRTELARELVGYASRRGLIRELVQRIEQERPNQWQEFEGVIYASDKRGI